MKKSKKLTLTTLGIMSVMTFLVVIESHAQVFTPFFIGNNPPLVSLLPPTIPKIVINDIEVTDIINVFQTQTGDVWHLWEPVSN